jgi:hypothetical protein
MNLIGLVGFKQSGKSTAAKYLEEKYGYVRHNFKDALIKEIKQNFPDFLIEIACIFYELPKEQITKADIDNLFNVKPPLMRALMINYGTEVRRREDADYWVKQWRTSYMDKIPSSIVCDDVRFKNEAWTIWAGGGKIVRIIRTDIPTGGNHPSETEQLEIEADYTIELGQGEQDKLYAFLDEIVI